MLCLKNSKFDAVPSFGVMEHITDNKFLHEIFRVLNGGYNFIFDLPNKYTFTEVVILRFLELILRRKFFYHRKRYTKREIKNLLSKNGFKDIKIKREFIIPAQLDRINQTIGKFFNKYYMILNKLDKFLTKTFLNFFLQTFTIQCKN